jgi:Sortase domain
MNRTSRGPRPAGPRLANAGTGAEAAPGARTADSTGAAGAADSTRTAGAADSTRTAGAASSTRTAGAADSTGTVPPDPCPEPARARSRHRRPRLSPLALAGRPAVVAVGIGLVLAGSGAAGLLMGSHRGYVPPRIAPAKPVLAPVGRPQTPVPQRSARVSAPVSLTIPAIGVRTRLIRLGITKSGALQVPANTTVAGWYTRSPPPGAVGSSVIVGHVDSLTGPGIFYRLHLLGPRNLIYVRQRDGRLAVFRVNSVHQYTKRGFPTVKVYGPAPTPQLRLITCGGTFDVQTGRYLSNIVVYATML